MTQLRRDLLKLLVGGIVALAIGQIDYFSGLRRWLAAPAPTWLLLVVIFQVAHLGDQVSRVWNLCREAAAGRKTKKAASNERVADCGEKATGFSGSEKQW